MTGHNSIQHKKTGDGSSTLFLAGMDETYHSVYGAVNESMHVFIRNGLAGIGKKKIVVFEVGFGAGINALLAFVYAKENNKHLEYYTIEKYPLDRNILNNFQLGDNHQSWVHSFYCLHDAPWNVLHQADPCFFIKKIAADLYDYDWNDSSFDVVFFDAFAPDKQPELWTPGVFVNCFMAMNPGGVLTTYSAKGQVRRNMTAAGFDVERLPGPPGKREMLKATKNE